MLHTPHRLAPWLLVLTLAVPTAAGAQVMTVTEWKITRTDTGQLLDTETERSEFFNKANCECNIPLQVEVKFDQLYPSATYDYQIVAGESCLDTANGNVIRETCAVLVPRVGVRMLGIPSTTFKTTARALMLDNCDGKPQTGYTLAMYTNAQNSVEWQQDTNAVDYTIDSESPDPPKNPSLKAGESQVTISFDSHTTTATSDAGTSTVDKNFKGYQVLCETTGGAPALGSPKKAEYRAAVNVCGGSTTPVADAGSGDGSSGASLPGPIPRAAEAGPEGGMSDAGVADLSSPDAQVTVDAGATVDVGPTDSAATQDSGGSSGSGAASLDDAYVCSGLVNAAGSITVSGLKNGESYRFYLITIDEARNPSTPIEVGTAQPQLAEDLWERYKRLGGEADGGYCYIATAVHGSYDHPHVRVLREFRDRVLMPTRAGRELVAIYYATSPPFADWLARHETARTGARVLLWPVTLAASSYLYTSVWDKGLVLLALCLGIGLVVRRRRPR